MKAQCYNPYLPLWEYVPDGEPHVFGNRVYIYGSHDRFDGDRFCMNDYVCWSADVKNLREWRYEGVIYKRIQDPRLKDGKRQLWAPDVVQGKDGKYYLYYCPDGDGEAIGVAICDKPAGRYEFYGFIKDSNGSLVGKREGDIWQFDPGVFIDKNGRIYLYSGNGPKKEEDIGKTPKNSCVMELADDMLTIKEEPRRLLPILGEAEGTGFEGHEFFEASSIRKIGKMYYLIYSSVKSRELCYAVSEKPDRGYKYGGVVIDNSGIMEKKGEKRIQILWGNNHGGIEKIEGNWYVFYHRPTNMTQFSRQGCAEPLTILENGKIVQAEMTSQGLNGKPLKGEGAYPASIACILHGKEEPGLSGPYSKKQPYVTQDAPDITPEEARTKYAPQTYITEIDDGTVIGYKYFRIQKTRKISVKVRGCADGVLCVKMAGIEDSEKPEKELCQMKVQPSEVWTEISADALIEEQTGILMFIYHGSGTLEFREFSFE